MSALDLVVADALSVGELRPIALGEPDIAVEDLHRLSGGASRETWSLAAVGPDAGRNLILRRDPPGAAKQGMGLEARLFATAAGRRPGSQGPGGQ